MTNRENRMGNEDCTSQRHCQHWAQKTQYEANKTKRKITTQHRKL